MQEREVRSLIVRDDILLFRVWEINEYTVKFEKESAKRFHPEFIPSHVHPKGIVVDDGAHSR